MPRKSREDDPFKLAELVLDGVKWAEEVAIRQLRAKCEWSNPADKAHYMSMMRAEKRAALLDRLVPNRQCPLCHKVKLGHQQWVEMKVVSVGAPRMICRSCWTSTEKERSSAELATLNMGESGTNNPKYNPKSVDSEGSGEVVPSRFGVHKQVRYKVDGVALYCAILEGYDTMSKFSRRAGWSTSYTWKLTMSIRHTSEFNHTVIRDVLAERGIEWDMPVVKVSWSRGGRATITVVKETIRRAPG